MENNTPARLVRTQLMRKQCCGKCSGQDPCIWNGVGASHLLQVPHLQFVRMIQSQY